jgi:iron complex outermembrane receptor protein
VSIPFQTRALALACSSALAAFSPLTALAQTPAATPSEPVIGSSRNAGIITITGARISSLPTQIPTTIESITGAEIEATVNATDSADALKYFPSLLVRKRYIGDYDHAVLSTRASGTGNSARSLIFADGILLSNLLGNGAFFTPRWGLVTPEEIARVDVLYGPFSAAYPGNSVGAVVDYQTRMPTQSEAHARVAGFTQRYDAYRTNQRFSGGQASASIGSREGNFAWWFNLSRQDSESHPLVYVTRTPSTAAPAAGATVVTGAVAELNRFNQAWLLIGTTSQTKTVQDHAKLKLAYRFTPALRASYTLGWWDNTVQRLPESFLQDASGARIDIRPDSLPATPGGTRAVSLDGRGYTLSAADFGRTRERLQHVMHGLSLKQSTGGSFDWEVAASLYDYAKDEVRAWVPVAATASAAANAAAGRITDQEGTGWNTFAAKGIWRPDQGGASAGRHIVEFGLQRDAHQLRNKVSNTTDWVAGASAAGNPASRFEGNTTLTSLWAQDVWTFAPDWKAVLGLRLERWQASRGLTTNGNGLFAHPARSESDISPKLALGWQPSDDWSLKLATGRAVRYPTVSELFQGGVNAATGALSNGDPDLRAEVSQTTELSAEWLPRPARSLRATLFHEATRDALYSQTNTTVTPNVTNIQNVDRIRTWGVELAGSGQDVMSGLGLKGLDLSGSVTFADSIITANARFPASVGKWQPRVPRWRANAVATWRATETISGTLGLRYSGKQFNSLDNSDPNGARYQGASRFLVADMRLRWQPTKQWSASLGIDNLNNALYWNFHPYPLRTYVAELKFDL